jgi:hypothetical protein
MLTGAARSWASSTSRCASRRASPSRSPTKASTAWRSGTGKALEYEKQLRHVIDYDS